MKNDLRDYGYLDNIPLSSKCEQLKDYFDKKFDEVSNIKEVIKETIIDNIPTYDDEFKTINDNIDESVEVIKNEINESTNVIKDEIDESTEEIINQIKENGNCECCCQLATKKDIKEAVEQINSHTDSKFDEINFRQQFQDLNKQILNLNKN